MTDGTELWDHAVKIALIVAGVLLAAGVLLGVWLGGRFLDIHSEDKHDGD